MSMDFTPTPRAQEHLERVGAFMDERIHPVEDVYGRQMLA